MLLISIHGIVVVEGYSTGAPQSACRYIWPRHYALSIIDPLPYWIDLQGFNNNQYIPGQTYTSEYKPLLNL